MAKSQATCKPTTPKNPISSAAKRPQKTQKFLDDIKQALDDFDDEVSSFASEQREVAYHNFATYYRDALTAIWPKATDASIKTVLKSEIDSCHRKMHGPRIRTYTWCADKLPSTTKLAKYRSLWAHI